MRKVTTTKKINETINNNLLQIEKAEVYNKTSGKTEIMDVNRFTENLSFFCESGVFANALGWHYEKDIKTSGYIAETGRMNPDVEIVILVYLGVCEDVGREDVERTLRFAEEEINDNCK